MSMRRWTLFAVSILLGPAPAFADVTLHYAPDGQGSTGYLIEADDHGHIRATTEVDTSDDTPPGMQLLLDGDQAYMIDRTPRGPALVRIEDVLALAAEARMRRDTGPARPAPRPMRFRVSPHGTERVGQWNGNLYWVESVPPTPHDTPGHTIVSNDPALLRYAPIAERVMFLQVRLLSAVFGLPVSAENEHMMHDLWGGGLLLRQADSYHLDRISTDPIPAERFAIGGPVLTRDQARALHAGQ